MNRFNLRTTAPSQWRANLVYVIMVLVFIVYVGRLFELQVIRGEELLKQANENRQTLIRTPTQRGNILDRNGFVLAHNVPSYNVIITPANLPGDPADPDAEGEIQRIYRTLSDLIKLPVNQGILDEATTRVFKPCDNELGISQIVTLADSLAPYSPVRIKCDIDQQVAMIIREKASDLPGVGIEVLPVRDYPTGLTTSEVIGFLGPIPASEEQYYRDQGFLPNRDKVGYAGLEQSMNDELIGKNGERLVEVDTAGQVLRDLQPPVDPTLGNTIRLTIDTRLQTAAKAALQGQMDAWNRRFPELGLSNGVVIAMNPKTGEILALVSIPSYENNRMARQIPAYYYEQLIKDPAKPLLNQAISAEQAPGSVFKMTTAVGILNEGVVTPEQIIDDPGRITILQKFAVNEPGVPIDYVCYIYKSTLAGHGKVDFLRGISESCDVYFYKVGGGYKGEVDEGLGIWRIGEYSRALGYGDVTGIELPGEASGLIPDPNWKRINQGENWSTGDTYIATIGQGFVTATPIQVLLSIATIANDGKMMKPTLIREVIDSKGSVVQPFTPKLTRDVTKEAVISVYDQDFFKTDQKIAIAPSAISLAKQGMRLVVTNGTAKDIFTGFAIQSAGKTGTAEYCDDVAQKKNRCRRGDWPAHAWYVGYAPFDNPEIAVVAWVYNGNEGSTVAAPIVRTVMEAYFDLKGIDGENSTQK